MGDPFDRLKRRVIGGHLHGLPGLVLRLDQRSQRKGLEPAVVQREHRSIIELGTRRIRRLADPQPNAPQLIRVVKTPYTLARGWARRKKVREARPRLERHEPYLVWESYGKDKARQPFLSPAGTRPRLNYPLVPRGLAARYLSERSSGGAAE